MGALRCTPNMVIWPLCEVRAKTIHFDRLLIVQTKWLHCLVNCTIANSGWFKYMEYRRNTLYVLYNPICVRNCYIHFLFSLKPLTLWHWIPYYLPISNSIETEIPLFPIAHCVSFVTKRPQQITKNHRATCVAYNKRSSVCLIGDNWSTHLYHYRMPIHAWYTRRWV